MDRQSYFPWDIYFLLPQTTFHVLATIRKRLCDKLAKVPLGRVKDTPSGSLKNIMVERVDSIETTLAHVLPEFTANLMAPLAVFIYLLIIDWRMALVSLITLVLGLCAYMGMMIGYEESYQNTVNKTKILNDTAVEYINGIEVIKAFGKAQKSYEKFEAAAKEGCGLLCGVDAKMQPILLYCHGTFTLYFSGGSANWRDFFYEWESCIFRACHVSDFIFGTCIADYHCYEL